MILCVPAYLSYYTVTIYFPYMAYLNTMQKIEQFKLKLLPNESIQHALPNTIIIIFSGYMYIMRGVHWPYLSS